jgi:hypothetical protein
VTAIKEEYLPDLSRTTILDNLDRVQRVLFGNDCAQTTFFNTADGDFPYPLLSTTSGNLSYLINASTLVDSDGNAVSLTRGGYTITIRRVKRLFMVISLSSSSSDVYKWYGEPCSVIGINPYWHNKWYHSEFYEVPAAITDKSNLEAPRVTFLSDPGTYDDRYYVECFIDPVSLSSESIPLTLDGSRWEEALIEGVVGFVKRWQTPDNPSPYYDRFMNYHVKKFQCYMNEGADQLRPVKIKRRECG